MKKNRMMIKRKRRKGTIILVAVFCIILPITAIYIGLRITEHLVSPVLNNDDYHAIIDRDNPKENQDNSQGSNNEKPSNNNGDNTGRNDNKITNNFKPFSIYTIQIASLAENNNLEGFIGELNSKKLPHLIYKMDSSYKVYVIGGTKRTHVESELERVKKNYPDAYISKIHASEKKLEYIEDEDREAIEAIIADFNQLMVLMEEQGEAWYNFFKKEGELDSYIELLKKQRSLLGNLSKNLAEVELPNTFPKKAMIEKMITYQEGNINRSIEFYEEDLEANTHRIHSLYLDNLFRVIDIIKG